MFDSRVPPHSNQSRVKTGKREPKFEEAGKKRAALFHVHAGVETDQAARLPGHGLPSSSQDWPCPDRQRTRWKSTLDGGHVFVPHPDRDPSFRRRRRVQ